MRSFAEAKEEIKTRTPDVRKAVKIYTIELLVFSVVFIVLGILELLGIIGNNVGFRSVFTYVTMVGVVLFIALTIFTLSNEKRRAKSGVIDRVMLIPAPIAILILDILTLIKGVEATLEIHRLVVGIVFLYFGACYIFQAIYHYYIPLPLVYEVDEEKKPSEEKPAEAIDFEAKELPPSESPAEKEDPKGNGEASETSGNQ